MKKNKSAVISAAEVRRIIRVPLPKQTGGRHKDRRDISRQEAKIRFKKGGE